jgi:pimeloyl-ACP methyl ester carboxylesterase
MSEPQVRLWKASDGIELAYHELGAGRPVVLLHGLFSDAVMNWIKFGHAARIARDGFRVIMPDPHWLSIQFMKSQKVDRVSAGLLLESFADAFMEWLQAFTMPTLVVCGSEDDDNGSAADLAAALPDAIFREVPGTHMSSVTRPELGEAIAAFLSA